jgi:two-component system response regulator NreC
MITIVLADDHHVVRQGLRSLLETEPDMQIIGETADGLEAVRLVENLQPDVLVLDLMMRGISGLEVTREVDKHSPQTKVVILSMYSNEAYVLEALHAGAKAYILKEATADELVRAIREAAAGRRYLCSALSEHAIEAYLKKSEKTAMDPFDTLTTREREVMQLAAQGCTNADIAKRLYISRRTVEAHRASMMQKLGLHTQTDLIRYALQRRILPPDSQ